MKFKRRVSVLAGVVLFSGIAVPGGQAFAFGQQWRPTPGFASTQGQRHLRVANVPRFRPRVTAPAVAQSQYRPRPQGERYAAASPRYTPTRRHRAAVHPLDPYRPGYRPAYDAPAVWMQPFSGIPQMWQPQMPVFGREFAWRATERPSALRWAAPEPWNGPPTWETPRNPAYRPAVVGRIPMAGSWRPAVAQPYAARQPLYSQYRQAAARLAPRVERPTGLAGIHSGRPSAVTVQWRPAAPLVGSIERSDLGFRPNAYGRNLNNRARMAARGGAGGPYVPNALPGFVTTHQDGDAGYACTWCSGS